MSELKPTKLIEAYGLLDYSLALQTAFREGYVVDASTNENCPTNYGGFFCATLVLSEESVPEVQKDKTLDDIVATKTVVDKPETRGRKAKSS